MASGFIRPRRFDPRYRRRGLSFCFRRSSAPLCGRMHFAFLFRDVDQRQNQERLGQLCFAMRATCLHPRLPLGAGVTVLMAEHLALGYRRRAWFAVTHRRASFANRGNLRSDRSDRCLGLVLFSIYPGPVAAFFSPFRRRSCVHVYASAGQRRGSSNRRDARQNSGDRFLRHVVCALHCGAARGSRGASRPKGQRRHRDCRSRHQRRWRHTRTFALLRATAAPRAPARIRSCEKSTFGSRDERISGIGGYRSQRSSAPQD